MRERIESREGFDLFPCSCVLSLFLPPSLARRARGSAAVGSPPTPLYAKKEGEETAEGRGNIKGKRQRIRGANRRVGSANAEKPTEPSTAAG